MMSRARIAYIARVCIGIAILGVFAGDLHGLVCIGLGLVIMYAAMQEVEQ